MVQEHVLLAGGAGAVVGVEDHDVGAAVVKRVVVFALAGVVRGGVERVAPGLPVATGRVDVVVAQAGPQDEAAEQVGIRGKKPGVPVARRAIWVNHVAGMEDEIGRALPHAVADSVLVGVGG